MQKYCSICVGYISNSSPNFSNPSEILAAEVADWVRISYKHLIFWLATLFVQSNLFKRHFNIKSITLAEEKSLFFYQAKSLFQWNTLARLARTKCPSTTWQVFWHAQLAFKVYGTQETFFGGMVCSLKSCIIFNEDKQKSVKHLPMPQYFRVLIIIIFLTLFFHLDCNEKVVSG